MATTELPTERVNRQRIAVFVLVGLAVVGVVAALVFFYRPPQMGADEDVFRTVDALYTAVRMKDPARVADCEERLRAYQQAGKLPDSAADYLARVIAKTRDGRWQAATESLYEFMLAQQRAGGPERAPTHQVPATPKGKAR